MTSALSDNIAISLDLDFLNHLSGLLENLVACYDEHLKLLTRKRTLLIGSTGFADRAKELQGIDRSLMNLNQRAGMIERERRQLQVDSGCQSWTLVEIIQYLNLETSGISFDQMTQKMTQLRQRLERALLDSQQINQEIRGLLELSIGWIQETVDIVAAASQPEGASYTAQGGKARGFASKPDAPTTSSNFRSTISHSA